ncbi:MAG: carbon starvation CstA family protein [Opitutales bacterium]
MILFLLGLLILTVGYFSYSKVIERIVGVDDSATPSKTLYDGVDYIELPNWKNKLIQLLNIAGVGPVIGVILGIKFGAICFIIIPIGNIFAGAVHDYLGAMISIKNRGENLPWIIRDNLGRYYSAFFNVFMIFLLILVVAVFINIPANLIVKNFDFFKEYSNSFFIVVCLIFAYYIVATLFPINKIIGKIYPYIGAILIIGTLVIFGALMFNCLENPSLLSESAGFLANKWTTENNHPIIPLLFVTIACGIISGFHATQSPIVTRTIKSQKQCRQTFYAMMVLEGFIAMIWAGAGLAIYNLVPEYMSEAPTTVLINLNKYFLGDIVGLVTILAVIILAITSGDTALRSLRLSLASMLKMPQVKISKRLILIAPLIIATSVILYWSNVDVKSFNNLWNYFAWGNQVLAASTLSAASVWLFKQGKNGYVALIPALFMTFIVLSYILWVSPAIGQPVGFGLSLNTSYIIAGVLTFFLGVILLRTKKSKSLN